MNLQSKVDQILAAVKSTPPEDMTRPELLIECIEHLEAREWLVAERISLKVEMGIQALDNNHKVDHQQIITTVEKLIYEVSSIKFELQSIITDQST